MSWLEVLLQGRLKIACNRSNIPASFPVFRASEIGAVLWLFFCRLSKFWLTAYLACGVSGSQSSTPFTSQPLYKFQIHCCRQERDMLKGWHACVCVCACSVSEMEAFTNQRQVTQQACWCDRPHRSTLAPAASWIL